jgi:hypothetical protein
LLSLLTPRVWKAISDAVAHSKHPAHVAVAYFSEKGDRLLPLPTGSALVVDASISTIATGSTSPAALDRMRKRGTVIYSAQDLHAKVYAFRDVAFIGSANVSHRSELTLIEAVLRVDDKATVLAARAFVESLCLNRLSSDDLAELSRYYRPPKLLARNENQTKYSTLLMELTNEQGGDRETQVQPPKSVWEHFFGLKVGIEKLPILTVINESSSPAQEARHHVVRHHHNYTIELAGAELPRPAILQMRRLSRNKYSYLVHRPTDKNFASIDAHLRTLRNPLRQSGRRWLLI